MKQLKHFNRIILSFLLFIILFSVNCTFAADSISLYTPYTKISVQPGKSVRYSIDLINDGDKIINREISVSGLRRNWKYTLQSGGYDIKSLAVQGGSEKTFTLNVNVPFKVNKGSYRFYVKAGDDVVMPLTIIVSSQGSNETLLTCDQRNMQGTAKSTFSFKLKLQNRSGAKMQYALLANAPRGWSVIFKANYKQATSTEVDANGTKDITVDVKAPMMVKAGTYNIPVKVVSGSTSADMNLEVVITGTYSLVMETPTGLVSGRMTAGDKKEVDLVLKNTGSAQLEDIKLQVYSKPKNWEIKFNPEKIEQLQAGKITHVTAIIKADKKAIPGDYLAKFKAYSSEAKADLSFRVSVRTPMLWGWIGVLVILLALGSVIFLFKKYGRR